MEDPFDITHNVCRTVSSKTAPLVMEEFVRAARVLTDTRDLDILLSRRKQENDDDND